jgi:hypothetical protein
MCLRSSSEANSNDCYCEWNTAFDRDSGFCRVHADGIGKLDLRSPEGWDRPADTGPFAGKKPVIRSSVRG